MFDSRRELNRDLYAIRPNGCDLRRLTNERSNEQEPAISPDGKRIAFASDREGRMQIFVRELASWWTVRVTRRPEGADQPAWSPDGKRLVYRSDLGVFTANADGSGEDLVVSGLDGSVGVAHPMFANDGQRILLDRYNQIGFVKLDGTRAYQVVFRSTTTAVQAPSLSPDGSLVACQIMCEMGVYGVWMAPSTEVTEPCRGGQRLVSRGSRPRIGEQGFVVFERTEDASLTARIAIAQKGSEPSLVTPAGNDDRNPAWAPQGTEMPAGL